MHLAFVLALAAHAAAAQPPSGACSLSQPSRCGSTNELVWSRGFEPALRSFAGAARGNYLAANTSLAEQLHLALGGPPDEPRRLADGNWLFTACRAHSCMEKGAIVVDARGAIVAAGLLNFRCGTGRNPCSDNWALDIFVRSETVAAGEAGHAIRAWAREMEAQAPTTLLGRDRIARTEVHVLPTRGAAQRQPRAGTRRRR